MRVRGGDERTLTACQARSRYRTGLWLCSFSIWAPDPNISAASTAKLGTSIPISRDVGNHSFVERDFLNLARHLAQID